MDTVKEHWNLFVKKKKRKTVHTSVSYPVVTCAHGCLRQLHLRSSSASDCSHEGGGPKEGPESWAGKRARDRQEPGIRAKTLKVFGSRVLRFSQYTSTSMQAFASS